MSRHLIHLFVAFVVLNLASVITASSTNEQITQLENHVLEARRQITSGEFVVTVASRHDSRLFNFKLHSWVGPNGCFRQERTDGWRTDVVCVGEVASFHYDVQEGQFSNSNRRRWPSISLNRTADVRGRGPYKLQDPLLIMFTPQRFTVIENSGLEQFVGSPLRRNLAIGESRWQGKQAYRISFDVPSNGLHYYYDVVPSLAYSISQFGCRGDLDVGQGQKVKYEQTATCYEMQETNVSTWFPTRVVFHGAGEDGTRKLDEEVKVEIKCINKPLDKSIFTPSGGSGAPDGVLIVLEPKDKASTRPTTRPVLLTWEKGAIRHWTPSDTSAVALSASPPVGRLAQRKYAQPVAILLFLLGSAGLWYYIIVSRRKSRK